MPIRLLSQYLQLLATALLSRGERGQVGMEIALVGVVCASCVFGTAVIATNDQAAQQIESVLNTGLAQAGGTLVVNGSVVALAQGEPLQVEELVFMLGTAGRPGPVSLDDSAGPRLVITFRSETTFANDVAYTATEIAGDGDGLLEANEIAEVRVAAGAFGIAPASRWTLELRAPVGGVLEITRTMPFALERVNSLH